MGHDGIDRFDDGVLSLRFASGSGAILVRHVRPSLLETVHEGEVDDETFRRYLGAYGELLRTSGDYVVLVDLRRAGTSRARQRSMQAAMLREHADVIARHCRGAAFVVDSTLVRASLSVVLWLQRIRYPYVVVADRDEAERWLTGRV